jgi:AcrR family transcriptional regulator
MVKVEPSLRESQSANATIERILDAAEELFAERGVADTSVRNITEKAGVNVAAVNYHFGSRESLISRVVERRASILEAARSGALDLVEKAAREQGRPPTVEDLVNAMIEPVFALTQDDNNPGWQHFVRLISRVAWEPQVEQMAPPPSTLELFTRFAELLQKSLPDEDVQRRIWRIAFMRAATQQTLLMIGALKSGRIPKGMPVAEAAIQTPVDKIRREFVAFVAAGLQAKIAL